MWDPAWRRFQWWEYAGTTAAIGGSIALAFGAAYPDDGYRHGVLLDDPVRDLFLLRDRQGRDKAKILGNMLYIWSLIHPYLVDVVAVTWIGHGSGDVAWQMFLINLESHAVAGLLSLLADHHIGRARPSVEACERDPSDFRAAYARAAAAQRLGRTAEALAAYETALARTGQAELRAVETVLEGFVGLLLELDERERACRVARSLAAERPDSARAAALAGELCR